VIRLHASLPVVAAALLFGIGPPPANAADQAAERLFALDVKPLLVQKCFACHGQEPGPILGGLNLTSRESMLRGGASSKQVLVPGNAGTSLLYEAVRRSNPKLQMPPKENDRLTEEQAWKIRDWINAGAPWPDEETERSYIEADLASGRTADGITVTTSGGLAEEWTNRRYKDEDLWAFSPLRRVTAPESDADHPVDAFVAGKLAEANLSPSPRASKRILIRRATYDLTGLPPRPEEIEAFLNDESPQAWSKLINRLLESPHYGEQWGRHWLDVVRYADTSGYSNDWERSNAWRYRDYVVRSLNADKPYNRFVLEQIAGDILDPENPEMLVAAGYLRMGPWEHTGMTQKVVSRQTYLDDITNNVGQAFLSIPLRCAKCHDHKFDPIPTRDYYRFYSIFETTQLAERPAAFLDSENRNNFDHERARLEKLLEWAEADVAKINAKEEKAARAWCAERGIPYQPREKLKDKPEGEKPPRHIGLSVDDQGFFKVRTNDARIWKRRLERYQPMALTVYEGPVKHQNSVKLRMPEPEEMQGDPPESFILTGGSVYSRGEAVAPGVLSAIPISYKPAEPRAEHEIPPAMAGRRLALARWIASPDNPLSTRSIVNRIWQYHFGKGIAENTNNLGKMGKKPTHPELLDWMVRRFVDGGWSVKAMHRLIMTSQTYQRSDHPADSKAVRERDPGNGLLSYFRPRRLTAEELRDSMLAVSGELNPEVGGLPVFPEANAEYQAQPRMNQVTLAPAYQPARTREQRNRRSIYVYRMRMQADPMFEVFNQPSYDLSCERRDSSTVTPQVFTLMNSDNSVDRSIAMALRIQKEAETLNARVQLAFQLALGREASRDEQAKMAAHIAKMTAYHESHPPEPVSPPRELNRTVIEEMSGLALHYKERLDVYEDYVPHVKPWDVEPETRALADLCLALFNSNEFIYVY
jgi:mono/diheme cytochrome c family protein